MTSSSDKRHMLENEGVFREYNERVQRGFQQLQQKAQEEGWGQEIAQGDEALYYYCECSDENCKERILLKPSIYNKIHTQRDHFILLPGHENKTVEAVVRRGAGYNVVRKYKVPPKSATLHETSIQNT